MELFGITKYYKFKNSTNFNYNKTYAAKVLVNPLKVQY